MNLQETTRIEANGASIPIIGLGTWELQGEMAEEAVHAALRHGYRHIDTAQAYNNEEAVGRGIGRAKLPREELFVTTKVWLDQMEDGRLQGSVEMSLKRLNMSYVDLVLIHWPNPDVPLKETIGALCEVKRFGMARHIGLSNFPVALMDEAVALSSEALVTNQVEYHPLLNQDAVLAACRRHGMALTAYSPLGKGHFNDNPVLQEIALKHCKSVQQIALRWLIQQPDVVAIPRSGNAEHIMNDIDLFDFALSAPEMETISELGSAAGRLVDPGWAPAWDA